MKVIIDATKEKHFIVSWENGNPFIWISRSHNTLEMVIKQIGKENIKEIIQ